MVWLVLWSVGVELNRELCCRPVIEKIGVHRSECYSDNGFWGQTAADSDPSKPKLPWIRPQHILVFQLLLVPASFAFSHA